MSGKRGDEHQKECPVRVWITVHMSSDDCQQRASIMFGLTSDELENIYIHALSVKSV